MTTTISLEKRLTHHYVDSCASLDAWHHIGTARVLAPRKVAEGNDYDEGGTYLLHARIPAGQDPKLSAQALADHFNHSGCHHEYDCCGCRSTRATVRKVGPRDFSVRLSVSFNY